MGQSEINIPIKKLDELKQTRDFELFWNNCQTIFRGSLVWDNILRLKKEGFPDNLSDLLSSFKKEDKNFGNELLNAQKKGDYKEIGRMFFVLALRHIIDVKKRILNLKEDSIIKSLPSKLGHGLVLPFFVFDCLTYGPISEKVNALGRKKLKECLALFIGLWIEIYEVLRIEEETYISNPKREKQIDEFIGEKPKGMLKYYDLLESGSGTEELKREMKRLIKENPDFFDPYLTLADILEEEEKYLKAEEVLKKAYSRAMNLIVDKNGNFPRHIPWGILENRHIVRAISRWAYELWELDRPSYALEIFRRLLKSNPNDNIGARYEILAIRMGYEPDYAGKMFPAKMPGYVDAIKSEDWFRKNSKKFPEEFNWWFKKMKE